MSFKDFKKHSHGHLFDVACKKCDQSVNYKDLFDHECFEQCKEELKCQKITSYYHSQKELMCEGIENVKPHETKN